MKKNIEIEYLRGIAILFTIFHHIPSYLFVQPNFFFINLYQKFTFWGGVDLFFAISGYVIMDSFFRILKSSKKNYIEKIKIFWIRRFFRILPSAWFWLIIYLICTQYFNHLGAFGDLNQNIKDSIPAFLQYANIYGLSCWGPLASQDCGPNGIYWSLSLEEQFYFLLPLIIFIFRKFVKYILAVVVIILFFIERPEWSIGWALRFDAIILGVLISYYVNSDSFKRNLFSKFTWLSKMSFLYVLCSLALVAYVPAKFNQYSYSTGILSLICSSLVFLAAFQKNYINFGKLANTVLLWLGSRSYSLYLTHIIIFRMSHEILYQISPSGYRVGPADWFNLLAICLPILILISEFSYRFIECPTKKLGYKFI